LLNILAKRYFNERSLKIEKLNRIKFMNKKGFTLIELMIVIAIIAFLSVLAIPSLMKFLAKAKRTEAYINLSSLAMAEKAYFAEHGKYTTSLSGANSLNWQPEGNFNYTYGFSSGSEGQAYFVGALATPASSLSQAQITKDGFKICAAGDIDGDGKPDILCIDQSSKITILEDDLA